MSEMFTKKQEQLLSIFKHGQLKRINILEGSVRSGKTWISLVLWSLWVGTMPADGAYLMVAKTITALKRNCLDLLQTLVGKSNFTYNTSTKEGRLFGRLIYLEGVNDARSESKIRGMTLQGAYCDELTLFTEDFFAMLLSRLSMKGAKLFGTTNPDNPMHWLKIKYLNRKEELNLLAMQFLIDDNTTLDPEYIADLKKEYTGVFYERFILGKWVVAEGVIYDMWQDGYYYHALPADIEYAGQYITIDYGTTNPTAMYYVIDDGTRLWVEDEYYYSSKEVRRQKPDTEYADDLIEFIDDRPVNAIIIDPSAANFRAELTGRGIVTVGADNEVLEGIRLMASVISLGYLRVNHRCERFKQEIVSYSWDSKAAERGVEQPLQVADHAMDSIRYIIKRVMKPWRLTR